MLELELELGNPWFLKNDRRRRQEEFRGTMRCDAMRCEAKRSDDGVPWRRKEVKR